MPAPATPQSAASIGLILEFLASSDEFVESLGLTEKKAVFKHPGVVLFESCPSFAGRSKLQPTAHGRFIVDRRSIGRCLGEKTWICVAPPTWLGRDQRLRCWRCRYRQDERYRASGVKSVLRGAVPAGRRRGLPLPFPSRSACMTRRFAVGNSMPSAHHGKAGSR